MDLYYFLQHLNHYQFAALRVWHKEVNQQYIGPFTCCKVSLLHSQLSFPKYERPRYLLPLLSLWGNGSKDKHHYFEAILKYILYENSECNILKTSQYRRHLLIAWSKNIKPAGRTRCVKPQSDIINKSRFIERNEQHQKNTPVIG